MDTQGRRYTRAVKADILQIIRMWVAGMSAKAIAGRMGISVRTVYRRINRLQTNSFDSPQPYQRCLTNFIYRNTNAIKDSAVYKPISLQNLHAGSSFCLYLPLRPEVVGRDITTTARMLQVSSGSAIFQYAKVRHPSA
ncbi:hypothetical protein Pmani_023686 [Petrolisthes manimaculis]|uniref:Resolvase HTH domain-containing protein n=1 Tax=Petrolisthes manimaculis TaxID=1843537 RepID=A0AAE1PA66_9EUCA|nr:hypothetical protein Pmani_023686 [Petrolisthes manimaculis]